MVLGFGGSDNDITINIRADGTAAVTELGKVEKTLGNLGNSSTSFLEKWNAISFAFNNITDAAGKVFNVFGQIAGSLGRLGEFAGLGEELGSLTATFERLGGASSSLDRAREASLGLISQVDLLKSANRGLLLGIPDLETNFVKIADAGARLGNALGIGATEAVNQLTQAIATGRERQLKQFGILVDSTKAFKDYADSIGVSVDQLTEAEKLTIKQTQALKGLDEFLGRTDKATDSVANSYLAFKNTLSDTTAEVASAVNENDELAKAFRELSELIVENKDELIAFATVTTSVIASAFSVLVTETGNIARGFKAVRDELALLTGSLGSSSGAFSRIRQAILEVSSAGILTSGTLAGLRSGFENINKVMGFFGERAARRAVDALEEIEAAVAAAADPFNNLGVAVNNTLVGPVADMIQQFDAALPNALRQSNKALAEQAKAFEASRVEAEQAAQKFKNFGDALRDELRISDRSRELIQFENVLFDIVKSTDSAAQSSEDFAVILEKLKQNFPLVTFDEAIAKLKEIREGFKEFERVADAGAIDINATGNFSLSDIPIFKDIQTAFDDITNAFSVGGGGFTALQQALNTLGGIGNNVFEIFTGIFDGGFSGREGTQNLISSIFGGVGEAFGVPELGKFVGDVVNKVIEAFDGATKQPNTLARRRVEQIIDDALEAASILIRDAEGQFIPFTDLILGDKKRFGAEFDALVREFQESAPEAFGQFGAVGGALGAAFGESFADGATVGAVLFERFGGDLDSLRLLVQVLGVDFDTLKQGIIDAFLAGEIGALEAASNIRDLAQAFEPGLAAVGAYEQAFQNLIDSGGRGRTAIKSLQDLAVEALEDNIGSLEELRQRLLESGQFTQEEIDALFQAFADNGITSLEQLANASDELAINLLGNLEAQGGFFAVLAEGLDEAAESVEDINKQLKEINNTSVTADLRIRVSTEFNSPEDREALRQVSQGEGIGAT